MLFAFVGPGVLIILYWVFGLHALHFTTGFCTLCRCCCIVDMQTTILFTKACQPKCLYKSDTLKSDMLEYTEQPLTPKVDEIECKERCAQTSARSPPNCPWVCLSYAPAEFQVSYTLYGFCGTLDPF